MKNYGVRGGFAEADNTLLDLHNSSVIQKLNSVNVLLFVQNNS